MAEADTPHLEASVRALNAALEHPAAQPIATPPDDPLITAGTACALAGGISRMTLWRWREAGIVPAPIVIRGRNYFRRRAFLAALATLSAAG